MIDLQDKANYVERILAATRIERYSYLGVCIVSVTFLLVSAAITLVRNHGDVSTIIALFGSSGVITYSTGQIMRVWSDAMRLVLSSDKETPVER